MSQQPCLLPLSTTTKRKRDTHQVAFHDVNAIDASEYLQRVVQEARQISEEHLIAPSAAVTSRRLRPSSPPVDGSAASMQYLLSTQILPPPPAQRQAHEAAWITHALQQFEVLRDYLEHCQQNGVGGKDHRMTAVPTMKDAAGWMEFCTGHTDDDVDDDSTDDDVDDDNKDAAWRQALPEVGYHSPSVQLLCQMDQVMVRRVLAHLVQIRRNKSNQLYMWLYALMAKLEKPVHGQDAATLRRLVLTVAAQRAASKGNQAAMNLVLVVAGLYFGQASYQELFPSLS